ncbi:MAG: AAA family ATPase [Mollicutes bacterium]|nr:AAA family ATPase [Mollicutes bacterium]
MERRLQITAFRNIGFQDGKPEKEGLILNHTLTKGSLGDLVILIGANNSGKSNVLDALLAYKDKRISDRDVTDLYMEDECRRPSLKLVYNTDHDEQYGCRIFSDGGCFVNYPGSEKAEFAVDRSKINYDKSSFMSELNRARNLEQSYVSTGLQKILPLIEKYNLNSDSSTEDVVNFLREYIDAFVDYLKNMSTYSGFIGNVNYCPVLLAVKTQYDSYKASEAKKNSTERLSAEFKEKFGYPFEPTIYQYVQEKIGNSSLTTTYSTLANSRFILSVLKSIGVEASTIINAHNDSVKLNNRGILKTTEKKLNKALEKVARRFNKLYYLEDAKYSFEFLLESDKIFFTLYRGEQAISLDYQSTGFKWFFDLFFNLFSSSTLKPGDIVIMDEPATNLHVKGQIELRAFLKEFAMKNDITIVIATHSPFLIDLDFLDELRIVANRNNISSIENDFAAINIDDPDSLLPVKESLTVENHVLLDPDQNVVFVEGITDYNYLVGMKKVLGYHNLTFLPIKGVGKKGQETIISQKLIKIRKHRPFLLADADAAGKAIKKANAESELRVMILSEVDEHFKEIESLFSLEDAKKFGLVDANGKAVKHHSVSSIFKNIVISDPDAVSEETKENFRKVFEAIVD